MTDTQQRVGLSSPMLQTSHFNFNSSLQSPNSKGFNPMFESNVNQHQQTSDNCLPSATIPTKETYPLTSFTDSFNPMMSSAEVTAESNLARSHTEEKLSELVTSPNRVCDALL
jgi:hypothetical protein